METQNINPVDRAFSAMVLVLDQVDQDYILADMHNKNNLQSTKITEALLEIDIYREDVYHFGSIITIDRVEEILKEAVQ